MTEHDKKALGKTLWKVADILRDSMDADDFRDYMLAFLFLSYLSDNYQNHAEKSLGPDYPDAQGDTTPLQRWYDENKDQVKDFETEMRRSLHYVMNPKYLWENIANMALRHDPDLLEILSDGFKDIEENSFDNVFRGLFDEINLDSEKLGRPHKARNIKLCEIITAIAKGLKEFSVASDSLGDAYEYLIEQFAAGGGRKAGEFYTPQTISTILSRIVVLDPQDPKNGNRKKLERVLDFACGSGSLLLNVRNQMKGNIGKIYGQEKNITTYNLARMNMLLHGVKDSAFEIFHGDTLTNDWETFRKNTDNIEFDAVVANPPFSYRWEPKEDLINDERFAAHGLAPRSAADFAFLLHGFHYLAENGTMAIILPHGVLFRGGTEGKIRKELLEKNNIDAVIGMPGNLFYSTSIPVCILVLKKCRKHDDILFINASEEFEKDRRQNVLTDVHIEKTVKAYQNREEHAGFSKLVSMADIADNNNNLNISGYISTAKEELPVDLGKVHGDLEEIHQRIGRATNQCNDFLGQLDLSELR